METQDLKFFGGEKSQKAGGFPPFHKGNKMKRWAPVVLGFFFVIFLSIHAHAQTFNLRILHINDFDGFAEPYKPLDSRQPLGGIAYLAGKVKDLRQEKPTLLLATGDMIQGNNWANLSQGESVIELMNAIQFDVMVLGNHDFDFGRAELKKRISQAAFPFGRRLVLGDEDHRSVSPSGFLGIQGK